MLQQIELDRTYSRKKYVDDDNFYNILDFAIETIRKQKIIRLDAGGNYHYMTFEGDIKVFWIRQKNRNEKNIVFRGKDFEFSTYYCVWDEIEIKAKSIEIEMRHGGLTITFKDKIKMI